MKPSLTDTLCTKCGLCCDGSLFADVELAGPAEAVRLEVMGVEIEDEDHELLVLPCAALRGRRCGIYAHRPECCRTFECRLLQDVRHGTVGVKQAGEHIAEALRRTARVRQLAKELGQHATHLPLKERFHEALALADEAAPNSPRQRKGAELEAEMSAVEELIRKRFLAGSNDC